MFIIAFCIGFVSWILEILFLGRSCLHESVVQSNPGQIRKGEQMMKANRSKSGRMMK